jgi:DNA modification methylase
MQPPSTVGVEARHGGKTSSGSWEVSFSPEIEVSIGLGQEARSRVRREVSQLQPSAGANADPAQDPRTKRVMSPKRPVDERAGLGDVFSYYAGFSYDWARKQLAAFELRRTAVVLDPWNGSGTTTLAAQSIGLASVGVDLNPVASIVAQLKFYGLGAAIQIARAPEQSRSLRDSDPLHAWFTSRAAARIRAWADDTRDVQPTPSGLVVMVSLFRVVRSLTKSYEGSNPTWVRTSGHDQERVDLDDAAIDELVHDQQVEIVSRLLMYSPSTTPCLVTTASADRLPVATSSIDAILTSPPYLTRIDYAIAYSRELAVLGIAVGRHRSAHSRSLRAQLMGTTLIRRAPSRDRNYSTSAAELIQRVADHPSKDSSGYYLKQIGQYLGDLTNSLDELARVAKAGAFMTLVVQDSYYKDIRIPLAGICVQEAEVRGWELIGPATEYDVKRYLTQLNTAARAYPKGNVAESVMTLRRI